MEPGRTEFELKLTGAPADLSALLSGGLMAAVAPRGGAWERLSSTYFDTPDGALAAAGVTLRLREEAAGPIQAVKTNAAGLARREYEISLARAGLFPVDVGDPLIDRALEAAREALVPVAATIVDRWAAEIDYQGARIELAVDLGRAECRDEAGRRFAGPMAELELELLAGPQKAVFALARLLAEQAPLRLSLTSKYETALALKAPAHRIAKEQRASITADMTAGDVLAAALAASARRVASLPCSIVDMRLEEGVHQMRVALRRLRAIERIFRRHLGGEGLRPLSARARLFARALAPARALDVFLGQTLPAASQASGDHGRMQRLKAQGEAARAARWRAAADLVASRDFARFTLDLSEAATLEAWREGASDSLDAPAPEFAAAALDRAWKKVRRAASAARGADAETRHAFRIEIKKFRYAAQLFGPLYEKADRKAFMSALSSLQEALGALNDAAEARAIADEAAAGGGEAAMRAAGFIAGYKAAEAQICVDTIDASAAAFEKMRPFWT